MLSASADNTYGYISTLIIPDITKTSFNTELFIIWPISVLLKVTKLLYINHLY